MYEIKRDVVKKLKKALSGAEYLQPKGVFDTYDLLVFDNFFSDEAVERIIEEINKEKHRSSAEVYSDMLKRGLLDCEPQMYKSSLVFGAGERMCMYEKAYFRVSEKPDGARDLYIPCCMCGCLAQQALSCKSRDLANFIVTVGALSAAYSHYEKTKKFLDTPEGIISFEEFIDNSAREFKHYSVQYILNSVSRNNKYFSIKPGAFNIAICDENSNLFAILSLSVNSVSVITLSEAFPYRTMITLPTDIVNEVAHHFSFKQMAEFYCIIVEFILMCVEIHPTYYGIFVNSHEGREPDVFEANVERRCKDFQGIKACVKEFVEDEFCE